MTIHTKTGIRQKTRARTGIVLGLLFLSAAQATNVDPAGYWKFDEGDGTVIRDSGTGGLNGTIAAGTYAQGKDGSALCFDGRKGYAVVPGNDSLNIAGPLTLEMWVYLKNLPPEDGFYSLAKKGEQYLKKEFWLRVCGPSKTHQFARWIFEIGDGKTIDYISNANVKFGEWQHIVCVFDTKAISLYIDGKRARKDSVLSSIAYPKNDSLVFGGYAGSGQHTPDGMIDEVKIYNRALSESEIIPTSGQKKTSSGPLLCCSALSGKTGYWENPDTWKPKGIPGPDTFVKISAGDTVIINENAAASRITIEKGSRLIIDAEGNKRDISLIFKDVSLCGFETKGEGELICRGSSDHGITILMFPSASEAEVPRSPWTFPYSGTLTARYTTFVNGSNFLTRKIDVNNCTFRRTGRINLRENDQLVSFSGNLLDRTRTLLLSKIVKNIDNITVINSQSSAVVAVNAAGCVEFNNCRFDSDRVSLKDGSNLVSLNHGHIPGNYVVAATQLCSSSIEHKITAADNLHLVSGTFTADEDTECNNLIVDFGTTLIISEGKTLRANGGCLQEGEILQRGSLLVSKPGPLQVTGDSRKIPVAALRKIPGTSSGTAKIGVLDTQEYIVDNFLPSFNLSYDILPGLQNIDSGRYSLLILGLNEVKNNPEPFEQERDRLLKFVNEGGVVLAFQQNASGWFDTWLPYPLGIEEYSPPRAEIRDKKHPVFAGIPDSDLCEWKKTVFWNSLMIKDPHWKIIAGIPGRKDCAGMSECMYGKGTFILNNFAFEFDAGDILNLSSENTIKQMKVFANILKYAMDRASLSVPFELTVPLVDERELSARRKRIQHVAEKFDRLTYALAIKLDCISFDAEYARDSERLLSEIQILRGEIETLGLRVDAWKMADASLEEARELMKTTDELYARAEAKIEQLAARAAEGKVRDTAELPADRTDWIQNRFHMMQTDVYGTTEPGSIDTLDVKYKYFGRLHTTYGWNVALTSPYMPSYTFNVGKQKYWSALQKASGDNGIGVTFALNAREYPCKDKKRGINGSFCWNNPDAIQNIKNQVKEIADMNAREPIPHLSVCFDEIGFRGGYCDICTRKFREYLKNKYSSAELESLGISDVDTVIPPMPAEREKNPVLWMEHQEFVGDSFENALREIFNYAHSLNKDIITYINESISLYNSGTLRASLANLSRLCDIFGIDPYREANRIQAFYLDLIRSSAAGPTIQFSGGSFDKNNDTYDRDIAIGMIHSQGVAIFRWENIWKYRPIEQRHNSIRWFPGRWDATVRFADRAKKLEEYLVNTQSASPVALLYSERSHCLDQCEPLKWGGTPNARYLMVQFGIYSALARAQIQTDPLFAEGLTGEKLGRYKVLIMADTRSLSNEEMLVIREWVKDGGILIATGSSTTLDRWGRKLPDYAFSDIFGLSHVRTEISECSIKINGNPFFDDPGFPENLLLNSIYGYEVVKPVSAEVLASLPDGSPGVSVNAYGRGKSIFIAAVSPGVTPSNDLDRKQFATYSQFLSRIVRTSLKEAGTSLPFEAEGADENVEVTMRNQPGRHILHFLNYGYTTPVKGITIRLRQSEGTGLRIFYPLDNREIRFRRDGNEISFPVETFDFYQAIVIEEP